jgi:hypothetical protein
MLDVTCYRNLGTTQMKALEEVRGGRFYKITAEIPFHCSFRFQVHN